MKRSILILIEAVFLFWFFLPFLLKGVLNMGNFVGMCAMGVALLLTVWHDKIEERLLKLRTDKWFYYGEMAVRLVIVLILLLLLVSAFRIAVAGYKKAPSELPVLVLGCSVKGEKPSRVLEERLNAACDYLSQHEAVVCIVSGGKGADEKISEASCMYHYLVAHGIDKKRLIQEDKATSTEENIRFSREILEKKGLGDAVVIVTSEFHEYRASVLAKEQGITAYAYGASTNLLYFPTYFFREVLGISYMWIKNVAKY